MTVYPLFIIFSSLAIGTTTTLLSTHWIIAWIGLEINTMAIIPLMIKRAHPRAVEAATKYFITQATASALILFSALLNAWLIGNWAINDNIHMCPSTLITIALAMKLGLAPFHFWLPEVLQGLTLPTGLILTTWQKIAPLAILFQLAPFINTPLLMLLSMTSILLGGWGGINQTQLRKILAFSSITHLGWMVSTLTLCPQLTLLNFLIYTTITAAVFFTLISLSTTKMTTLTTTSNKNPSLLTFTMILFLSLAGLPPLSGFLLKWLIMNELSKQNLILFIIVILLLTLFSLFFYLRIAYMTITSMSPHASIFSTFWYLAPKPHPSLPILTSFSIALLPATPALCIIL
uniref:NADH-ubiquinone oxidoreductase chain 2 n=1 Tax=Heleophryne purcelli TaxID=31911 RepID=S4V257_9NEOB|nr:NADH dehydrogenase subunit 2 [Heleophryne purcelli]